MNNTSSVIKTEFIHRNKLISDGIICPHDLYWTLYYIIKFGIKDVAYLQNGNSKQDIALCFPCCEDPSWENVYIKTINGIPFRMGWENKPNYSTCYCNSCKLASQYKFKAKWKKSERLLDKMNWYFREFKKAW